MKYAIIIAFSLLTTGASAQSLERSVVATSGGYSAAGGLDVSYTIGEVAVTTSSASGVTLTQGFQQPSTLQGGGSGTDSVNEEWANGISVYPNPNSGSFVIERHDDKAQFLTLVNVLGQAIDTVPLLEQKTSIHLELDNGVYYLIGDRITLKMIVSR